MYQTGNRWQGRDDDAIESYAVLPTEANDVLRPVHDRMPVILPPDSYALWLDPIVQRPEKLQPLLRPYPADEMVGSPVSLWVNDPRHEGPNCVEAVA